MSKVWDKPITADTDWGGDASTDNLPVSGRQVQAWIKGNIKNDDAISLLIAKWLNEHTTNSITFWKGLPIDSGSLKWVDEHLTVIGGTGGSETPQDLPFIYDPVKKAWEFKGDFVVTGAITMFGSLSGFQPSTVTEAVEVDGETIVKTKNSQGQWQLTAIGGGSGTGGGISAAEVNILISNALEPYALSTSIPTDNKQLSNGAGYATVSDLDTRINNLINGAPAAYDTLKEIADVLAGNVNSIGDILTALDTKATKTYVDAELAKYVKLATAQSIEAQHNFVNGLQIGGLPITKSASSANTIYLDANLVVSGAITMFGSGSTTFPTIWANIPFNLEHMSWDGSQWNVIVEGGSGSGGLDTNAVNVLISEYLTRNSYATVSDISSALVGYASQSWVSDNYLSKSGRATINVDEFVGIEVKSTDALITRSAIIFSYNNDYKAQFGWDNYEGRGTFLYNYPSYKFLGIKDDGTPYYDSYTLIHTGNIGFCNAGSATKLATARTIWGQSFDGTENITHGFRSLYADSYNGGVAHSILNNQGSPYGLLTRIFGNGSVSLQAQREANDAECFNLLLNHLGGNVAIGGTETGSCKLRISTTRSDTFSWVLGDLASKSDFALDFIYGAECYGLYAAINYRSGDVGLQVGRSDGGTAAYNLVLNPLGGNIAIGGTTAEAKLHVHGNAKIGAICLERSNEINVYDGDKTVYLNYASSGNVAMCIGGGNVTIGGTTVSEKFNVQGNVLIKGGDNPYLLIKDHQDRNWYIQYYKDYISLGAGFANSVKIDSIGNLIAPGAITMFSQLSMKNVIDYDGLSLAQLAQIKPARFTWKDGRDTLVHAGGIADEVMQVLPEVVYRTKDDKLTMDYGSAGFFIAASLIKPVIDHEQRLQSAEKEIKDLKAENKRLREQLRAS